LGNLPLAAVKLAFQIRSESLRNLGVIAKQGIPLAFSPLDIQKRTRVSIPHLVASSGWRRGPKGASSSVHWRSESH
jgi:hypothetical protein